MAKTKKKRDKAYRAKVRAVPWWYQDGESADSLRRTFGLYLYEGALALERGDATEIQVNVMCALFRLTRELSEKMENSDELRVTLARAEAGPRCGCVRMQGWSRCAKSSKPICLEE